jgi:endo-1,4-beta-xylanase
MKKIIKSTFFAVATTLISTTLMSVARPQIANVVKECGNKQDGKDPNFYTNYISNGKGCIDTKNGNGAYSTSWSLNKGGNYVAGKGWAKGSASRKVGYNAGAFSTDGTNFLTLYGWTKDSLIEYYVVDAWGDYRPAYGKSLGSVESDGGTYDIYKATRKNADNITGKKQDFLQYWSVRRTKTNVGKNAKNNVITFSNHVKAWEKAGLKLGKTWDYQIMATESYGGDGNLSGASDVTVWSQ